MQQNINKKNYKANNTNDILTQSLFVYQYKEELLKKNIIKHFFLYNYILKILSYTYIYNFKVFEYFENTKKKY